MTDVLIIGAGPTGLTLGCLLRRQGVDVRLVDRLPAPAPLTKAMVIWSRTLEVLDEIGVADGIGSYGVPLEIAHYLVADKPLASVRTDTIAGTRWQPAIVPQQNLELLLRRRFEELGPAIEWGMEAIGVVSSAAGAVATLHGEHGLEDATARYVVGCDGIRSAIREAAGIGWQEGAAYEEVFQLGDVTADTSLTPNQVHHFLGRSGVSVAISMPNGMWRVAGYRDGENPTRKPDAAELQRLFETAGHHGTAVREVHWGGTFRVLRRLASVFRVGNVFVAGDAAHVHSPAGGQGLNTGIQDVHNLAWKLAFVVRGWAGERLLDTYEGERRPIAASILKITELQDRFLFGARAWATRTIRNGLLRVLGRTGVLERRLIPDLAQLLVNYRRSALTVGRAPRGSDYRPGRRVPEIEFVPAGAADPVRLMAAVAGGPITLLAVPGTESGTTDDGLDALTSRYPGSVRLLRAAGPLPEAARTRRAGYVLGVRPDGHIGFRGPRAATPALLAWLNHAVGLAEGTGVPQAAADQSRALTIDSQTI